MSFTYDPFMGFKLPSDGDTDHGEEIRENFTGIGQALAPDDVFWVSPAFTEAEVFSANATDPRHFSTIQAAITAAQDAAGMTGVRPTIFVYPGTYAEKLTITGSVALVGLVRPLYYAYGGARGVTITGDGTASSIINWTPANSQSHSLVLQNLCLYNSYATTNATLIALGYAITVNAQGTLGSSSNRLLIDGCQFRMLTSGDDNRWIAGMNVNGWCSTLVRDSFITAYAYAGGNNNGGVVRIFNITGTNNASYVSSLYVSRCSIRNENQDPTYDPTIFYGNQYVNTLVTYSALDMNTADPYYLAGDAGTQTFFGMKSLAEFQDYQNIDGTMPFPM